MKCMDSSSYSKVKLLGVKSTNREVAIYIKKATLGDGVKDPTTKKNLAIQLSISRPTIDKYLKFADTLDFAFTNTKKTAKRNVELNDTNFQENPYIQKWIKNMDTRSKNGREFGGKRNYLKRFYGICKTLSVNPESFISGNSNNDVLETGRELMRNFLVHYKNKTAKINYFRNWNLDNIDIPMICYANSQAIRDFMKINGYSYPNGETGIMSQSINAFHGKYAQVRIKEETHQKIKNEIKEWYGLDSDEFRHYVYGIESMSRNKALFDSSSEYDLITLKNGKTLYSMSNIETKTIQVKGGRWIKHIFDEDVRESIKLVNQRSQFLIEDRNYNKFNVHMKKLYKEIFQKHGLTSQGQKRIGVEDSSYFIRKPIHVLRHAGAQRALRMTNWNVAYVAKRGWNTTQELIDSYGEMPPEIELLALEDYG